MAADLLPSAPVDYRVGELVREDIAAPKAVSLESRRSPTKRDRGARRRPAPVRLHRRQGDRDRRTSRRDAFSDRVRRIDTAFATDLKPAERTALLQTAIPGLTDTTQATLEKLDAPRWAAIRTEAARVLDATERTELRDTQVAETRARSRAAWAATSMRPSGCWRPR